MSHIKETLKKDFIGALKTNRLVAVSNEDHQANRFTPIDELSWLKDVPFPEQLVAPSFQQQRWQQRYPLSV